MKAVTRQARAPCNESMAALKSSLQALVSSIECRTFGGKHQERLRDHIGPCSGIYGMGYRAVQPLLDLPLLSFAR